MIIRSRSDLPSAVICLRNQTNTQGILVPKGSVFQCSYRTVDISWVSQKSDRLDEPFKATFVTFTGKVYGKNFSLEFSINNDGMWRDFENLIINRKQKILHINEKLLRQS